MEPANWEIPANAKIKASFFLRHIVTVASLPPAISNTCKKSTKRWTMGRRVHDVPKPTPRQPTSNIQSGCIGAPNFCSFWLDRTGRLDLRWSRFAIIFYNIPSQMAGRSFGSQPRRREASTLTKSVDCPKKLRATGDLLHTFKPHSTLDKSDACQ